MRYVFETAARDLQLAMGRPDGDISESLAARLVKGLIAAIAQPVEPHVDSVVGLLAQKYPQAESLDFQSERRPLFSASENVTDLFRGAIMTIIGLPFQVSLNHYDSFSLDVSNCYYCFIYIFQHANIMF